MKPYIKKIRKISNFDVWYIDGEYVRKYIETDFTNFGQHFRFKFIPKNEFWIDKEYSVKETRFFIDHLLIENRLMMEGKKYEFAITRGDKIEKRERDKLKKNISLKKIKDSEILVKKIHKKLLKNYSNEVKVWIVRGDRIRYLYNIDFTEGGHDKVYKFVPKGEIWIDDELSNKELKFVLLHEAYERNLMNKGFTYEKAHSAALKIEYYCRHNIKETDKILKKELDRQVI
ncbi:MAG: hypothetical protein WC867_08260 [Candidatus Pacearchaeota archaeon]|jgi:hypothetical protein